MCLWVLDQAGEGGGGESHTRVLTHSVKVVGDGAMGKASLIMTCREGKGPPVQYIPAVSDDHGLSAVVAGQTVSDRVSVLLVLKRSHLQSGTR